MDVEHWENYVDTTNPLFKEAPRRPTEPDITDSFDTTLAFRNEKAAYEQAVLLEEESLPPKPRLYPGALTTKAKAIFDFEVDTYTRALKRYEAYAKSDVRARDIVSKTVGSRYKLCIDPGLPL